MANKLSTQEEIKAEREKVCTHYCPRCGELYVGEGECDWCPGHVQLYARVARPAAEAP